MSESIKKKLVIYLVFLLVGSAIGLGASIVFDPILEVEASHGE
jgi:hypothetical protein